MEKKRRFTIIEPNNSSWYNYFDRENKKYDIKLFILVVFASKSKNIKITDEIKSLIKNMAVILIHFKS